MFDAVFDAVVVAEEMADWACAATSATIDPLVMYMGHNCMECTCLVHSFDNSVRNDFVGCFESIFCRFCRGFPNGGGNGE